MVVPTDVWMINSPSRSPAVIAHQVVTFGQWSRLPSKLSGASEIQAGQFYVFITPLVEEYHIAEDTRFRSRTAFPLASL